MSLNNVSVTEMSIDKLIHFKDDFNWNWRAISSKADITTELVLATIDKSWDWSENLSRNICIKIDLVLATMDKPWDYRKLSANPIITSDFVLATCDKPWDWDSRFGLSGNKMITPKLVLDTMDKPWNYEVLSSNIGITTEFVLATLDKPWNFPNLSDNPAITDEFVIENSHFPWTEERLVKSFNRWNSQRKISRAWKRCISNVEFEVCRKRLRREFEEFQGE